MMNIVHKHMCSPGPPLLTKTEQAAADKGFTEAARGLRLPVRMDTAMPSDMLASVQYGVVTAARISGDSTPTPKSEERNWQYYG